VPAVDPCHDAGAVSYDTCLREGFEIASGSGFPDVSAFHLSIVTIIGAMVFLVAAWMLSEIYNAWATSKKPTSFLINTPIRVIFILTIIIYIVF